MEQEFGLADGPAFNGSGILYVPDVKGARLYKYFTQGKKWQQLPLEGMRFSASFYGHGKLYLSDNPGGRIVRLKDNQVVTVADLSEYDKGKLARPNDLVVDNQGGIYVTLTKQNQVAYISPTGDISVAVEEIPSPNGIILSPSGKTIYVSAYRPKEIWSYEIKSPGKTADAKKFAVMDDGEALGADGMTIDRAGNVYCAGATDVWVWNRAGKLIEKIHTPTRPINCAFADQDQRTLYITVLMEFIPKE